MLSTSTPRRAAACRALRRIPFLLISGLLAACAAQEETAPSPPLRLASEVHAPKKSRVLVAEDDRAGALHEQLVAALRGVSELVLVDPVDVDAAPAESRERWLDYTARCALDGDPRKGAKCVVELVAARGGGVVERFVLPVSRGSRGPQIDEGILGAFARNLGETLARQPWSTSVLDVAERRLIIGGGRSTGIALGERLAVRHHTVATDDAGDRSAIAPGRDVAEIVVESYVTDGASERGAECRLARGSIGGFEVGELSVEELSPLAR
jgi:hypothetical protein